jgi:(p)ppGpp synthase/HD superfamily hydrolase
MLLPALFAEPELDFNLAICCAILHDTIEDTQTTYQEIAEQFGQLIAQGVLALSKNPELHGEEKMLDSLRRIKANPREISLVKLSDRLANLNTLPTHWSKEKIHSYAQEAKLIHQYLGSTSSLLGDRLLERIAIWENY